MIFDRLTQGVVTGSADETEDLACEFAAHLRANQTLALHGDLGTGKTTFVRGLARAWSISEPITSPTFNLYSIYQGDRQLIHLDAYRLSSSDDLDTLMIEDFMRAPWCFVVEWPEHIAAALPEDSWHLDLSINAAGQHQIQLRSPRP
ncbi:MAG: tRNA (adenosine(37)-N6)-threonylcarbamoyltransferase complex ATPase subunit type 1 TsaE [Opitutales bacterium]